MIEWLQILLSLLGVGILLFFGEQLRKLHYHPELARKFVHISTAVFAATWPFYLTWTHIELLSLLLFLGVLGVRRYGYFKAIRGRRTHGWGELFFAMSIGFAALLSLDAWVFAAAMLTLGLADGLAAVVGTLIGDGHIYKVFGHKKTRAGTITFWLATFLIVLFCAVLRGPRVAWTTLVWLPTLATLAENFGSEGLDNIIVPILIAISL